MRPQPADERSVAMLRLLQREHDEKSRDLRQARRWHESLQRLEQAYNASRAALAEATGALRQRDGEAADQAEMLMLRDALKQVDYETGKVKLADGREMLAAAAGERLQRLQAAADARIRGEQEQQGVAGRGGAQAGGTGGDGVERPGTAEPSPGGVDPDNPPAGPVGAEAVPSQPPAAASAAPGALALGDDSSLLTAPGPKPANPSPSTTPVPIAGGGARSGNGGSEHRGGLNEHREEEEEEEEELDEEEVGAIVVDPAILAFDPGLLASLGLLLTGAAFGGMIAVLAGLPTSLGFLLGGALVGPQGLALIAREHQHEVGTIAQLGVVFPLFVHGMMMRTHLADTARLLREAVTTTAALSISIPLAAITFAPAAGVASGIGEALLLGLALSLSSPGTTIANLLAVPGAPTSTGGRVITGVLALQDLLMGLLLAIPHAARKSVAAAAAAAAAGTVAKAAAGAAAFGPRDGSRPVAAAGRVVGRLLVAAWADDSAEASDASSAAAHSGGTPGGVRGGGAEVVEEQEEVIVAVDYSPLATGLMALVRSVTAFAFVLGITVLLTRVVVPRLAARFSASRQRELLLLLLVSLCMAMSITTERFGLSLEMGAFLAGIAVSASSALSRIAQPALEPMSQVFGGLFFSSIGMLIGPRFAAQNLGIVSLMAVAILLAKAAVPFFAMTAFPSIPRRSAAIAALALSQVSEFSLILTGKCHAMGLLDRRNYLLWLTATVVSLVFSPVFSRAVYRVVFGGRLEQGQGILTCAPAEPVGAHLSSDNSDAGSERLGGWDEGDSPRSALDAPVAAAMPQEGATGGVRGRKGTLT